jgi:hypothetical protein
VINIEEKIPVLKVLRWIFRKWDVGAWTGSSWLRIGEQLVAMCECGNEPSGSIKCGEFLN